MGPGDDEVSYDDLSDAGRHSGTEEPKVRPIGGPGPAAGGVDQRQIVLISMLTGLVAIVVVLLLVGLPIWLVALIAVADLVAMGVFFSKLTPR